ncbi:hypothetical protein ZWY2020_030556 [Hordeum vulgare]|nr:hypothetical protein ZWY2020_030556 [Hordeum vulgare]
MSVDPPSGGKSVTLTNPETFTLQNKRPVTDASLKCTPNLHTQFPPTRSAAQHSTAQLPPHLQRHRYSVRPHTHTHTCNPTHPHTQAVHSSVAGAQRDRHATLSSTLQRGRRPTPRRAAVRRSCSPQCRPLPAQIGPTTPPPPGHRSRSARDSGWAAGGRLDLAAVGAGTEGRIARFPAWQEKSEELMRKLGLQS